MLNCFTWKRVEMKIKKLKKLNNVFSYSTYDWDQINVVNDLNLFTKNNVLFGENGNGKSSLIKIFKSLNNNTISLEKHRDRQGEEQDIEIELERALQITNTGTGWTNNTMQDKFLIFDKDYIEKYVHSLGLVSSDSAERRQQRGKNIVYLGRFTDYNDEINHVYALKNELNDMNEAMLSKVKARIEGMLHDSNMSLLELKEYRARLSILKDEDLKEKHDRLTKLVEELRKMEKSIKEKSNISRLLLLSEIKIELELQNEQDIGKAFMFTVSQGLQETLHKIVHKKGFVRDGLSLIDNDCSECPFCEQKIKNGKYIQVVEDYKKIFDESFAKEEVVVKNILNQYQKNLEYLLDVNPPTGNQDKFNAVQQFIEVGVMPSFVGLTDSRKEIIRTEITRINDKKLAFLNSISDSKCADIMVIATNLLSEIERYNVIVKEFNTKLEQFKRDSSEDKLGERKELISKEIKVLQEDILLIENRKIIENFYLSLDNSESNVKLITSLERISQAMKAKILEEFNIFVTDYFELIKYFVKVINPSMEILDINGQATYDRRNVQDPAQCGFQIKYNGEDFAKSLSEGERQVVALAFFFAQLRKEIDKARVVVMDDPITSFDAGKRKSVAELIDTETASYEQLFVLTCDPLFREYCLKQIRDRNFYYVFKTFDSSSIHYYRTKKVEEFVNLVCDGFEEDFRNIDRISGSDDNIIVFGQKLRFCLETKIKEKYFGYSQDKFSNMIEQVASNSAAGLQQLVTNKDAILSIYSYCNTGGLAHHPRDGATSWNELKGKIAQYLSLRI